MTKSATRGPGDCPTVEPLLSSYPAGALDETSERLVRDHLSGCAACRAVQMERDPTVLFLELRRTPLPDGFLDTFAADVRRRVESAGLPFWAPLFGRAPLSARRLAYVAAPLMTLLLLGTLFLVRPGGPGLGGARRPGEGALSSPFIVPPGSALLGKPGVRTQGGALVAPPVASVAHAPGAPPLLEEVGSPGARVYRFMVSGGGEETPIYFVVDETIDIR